MNKTFGILTICMLVGFFILGKTALKSVEEKYMPVVNELEVYDWKVIDDSVNISGVINKNRECVLKDIEMYHGNSNHKTLVDWDYSKRFYIFNKPGFQPWGPLRIGGTEYDILNDLLYAKMTFSCHPLWDTVQYVRFRHVHPEG